MRAGSTLLRVGHRRGRPSVLAGLGTTESEAASRLGTPKQPGEWITPPYKDALWDCKSYAHKRACEIGQPGMEGACRPCGTPFGKSATSTPSTPSGGGLFTTAPSPSWYPTTVFGTPTTVTADPVQAPTPTPAPAPPPEPEPAPVCGVNWDTATAEIEGVISQLKSCQNPNAPLPAYVECPAGSTGSGTGSEPTYRATRAKYFEAKEQAGVLCPQTTQQTQQGYYQPTQYSTSPYSSTPVQTQDKPADVPLITPEGPILGRKAKLGIGIGGFFVLAGGLFLMMRRKRSSRA